MARKYTKVEALAEIIVQRQEAGETYREIGASLGLSRDEARGAAKRWRRKERKIAAAPLSSAAERLRCSALLPHSGHPCAAIL